MTYTVFKYGRTTISSIWWGSYTYNLTGEVEDGGTMLRAWEHFPC